MLRRIVVWDMDNDMSSGVTRTEEILVAMCQQSFLRLWSYANPYKDDGHEFCDVIAVFDNNIFIFFDREKILEDFGPEEDPQIRWNRWKRNTIDRQVATSRGAERYLRSGRQIFLDAKATRPLPVPFDAKSAIVHKIIVAHGAADACRNFSSGNISGSLAVSYSDGPIGDDLPLPFMVHLEKSDPVHVLDSHTLPILLKELDTVEDFKEYIDAKNDAIKHLDILIYCGEEDLLALYWQNFDRKTKKHFIRPRKKINGLMVDQGLWERVIKFYQYIRTKEQNKKSYFWDQLIQRTCDNWLNGKLLGDADLPARPNAIFEMAREPRFVRREFAIHLFEAMDGFPNETDGIARHMRYFNSFDARRAYVFLQLWVPEDIRGSEDEYQEKKIKILYIACGSAKNKYPHLQIVVGICIEPPKLTKSIGEDFLYLDCQNWNSDIATEIEQENEVWRFFKTGVEREKKYAEFAPKSRPQRPAREKIGRNQLCPCGSGKKFKRCHGLN